MKHKLIVQRDLTDGSVSLYRRADDRLFIRHVSSTRHHADHFRFSRQRADKGDIEQCDLDESTGREIIERFATHGSTEAFYLRDTHPATTQRARKPDDIRHQETFQERSYTAVGEKLNHHWPIFQKLRETGYGSIIRATMTLHQVCSSNCQFCSTILRNRSDSISLQEAKDFVLALMDQQAAFNREHFKPYNDRYKALTGRDIQLRGLILSGGGQPNLWPHFEEFVSWLSSLDLDLGLITNGFPRKIDDSIYDHFTWIRLSVTPAEASPFYPKGRFEDQYIPRNIIENSSVTKGLSYVYGPWCDDEMLQRLDSAAQNLDMDYCRLLTDCNLTRDAQLAAHDALAEKLHRLGLVDGSGKPTSKIFHQLKYHGNSDDFETTWPDGQCMLQSYNVFWDTTGHDVEGDSYCYPCDSVTVLAEEAHDANVNASERRFNPEKWGTVRAKQVADLYRKKLHAFFDPRDTCKSCLFVRNNQQARKLMNTASDEAHVPLAPLDHVNFP